jgi:hypothetical protein
LVFVVAAAMFSYPHYDRIVQLFAGERIDDPYARKWIRNVLANKVLDTDQTNITVEYVSPGLRYNDNLVPELADDDQFATSIKPLEGAEWDPLQIGPTRATDEVQRRVLAFKSRQNDFGYIRLVVPLPGGGKIPSDYFRFEIRNAADRPAP